jgi:hypothetical protein
VSTQDERPHPAAEEGAGPTPVQARRPWFGRKAHGWGWSPATWQGWLVMVAGCLVVVVIVTTVLVLVAR